MNAIFQYPPKDLAESGIGPFAKMPKLKKVEVQTIEGDRFYYDPSLFSKVNDLDVKKISNASRKFRNLVKNYRCFKVRQIPSYADGTFGECPDPRLYILNKDALHFNARLFKEI